jgi:hypothetical protein
MNINDIHMGDIAVTKEGVRYKIINFYYTYRKREEIRLDLQPIDFDSFNITNKSDSETVYSYTNYAWVGQIDNLNKAFDKIGEHMLNSDREEIMKQYEKVARKIDNAFYELNACGDELRKLRKMTLELLDK